VLFRPLAYDRPAQLVTISEVIVQMSNLYPSLPVNSFHFLQWQARSQSFSDLALIQDRTLNLTGQDGPPDRLGAERVTANLLPMWVAQPALGRNFTPEEDRPGNDREVILTDKLWRRRFHGDESNRQQNYFAEWHSTRCCGCSASVVPLSLSLGPTC